MANINWYAQFPKDLYGKVHDLFGTSGSTADALKIILSNAAPNAATHAVRADTTEIATAGGYTQGGLSVPTVGSVAGTAPPVFTIVPTDPSPWTRAGSFPTFQYVILYNDTPTSPADPLIAWWALASPLTMATDGDTFLADFGANIWTASFA